MVFDHDPPLAQHYYEGDGKGGLPGFRMTQQQREAYSKSLSVGKPSTKGQSDVQGGEVKAYSMRKRMEWFGF
jgi:hypothetical protein